MSDQSETEVLLAAREWTAAGHRVALATVVKTFLSVLLVAVCAAVLGGIGLLFVGLLGRLLGGG